MATVQESQLPPAAEFSQGGFQEVKAEGVPVRTAVQEFKEEEAVRQTESQAEEGFSQTGFQPEQGFSQGGFQPEQGFSQGGFQPEHDSSQDGFQPVEGEKVQSHADQTGFQPSTSTEQTGFQPQHDDEHSASNYEQKGFQPQPEVSEDDSKPKSESNHGFQPPSNSSQGGFADTGRFRFAEASNANGIGYTQTGFHAPNENHGFQPVGKQEQRVSAEDLQAIRTAIEEAKANIAKAEEVLKKLEFQPTITNDPGLTSS
jgi:hypothetical protein